MFEYFRIFFILYDVKSARYLVLFLCLLEMCM